VLNFLFIAHEMDADGAVLLEVGIALVAVVKHKMRVSGTQRSELGPRRMSGRAMTAMASSRITLVAADLRRLCQGRQAVEPLPHAAAVAMGLGLVSQCEEQLLPDFSGSFRCQVHGRTPLLEGNVFLVSLPGDLYRGEDESPELQHDARKDHRNHAIKDKVHMHDLHATILHLLGLNHEQLTYNHNGRPFRLADVAGHVGDEIIA
jgi:hypothetical protein